jgi:DNA repair exonuclease SbcCD nuclease subunit
MKIALITDTHLGVRNDNPQLLDNFKKSSAWFFKILDEKNVSNIIHLGDFFDRRKYISFITANVGRKYFFDQVQKRNISTHIICGNHDVYYKNTNNINSLDEMVGSRYDKIKIYKEPEEISIAGTNILLLPWITESNYQQTETILSSTKAKIVCAHLELQGFEMYRGLVCNHGMDASIFNSFDFVFTGHFHHISKRGKIYFIGAFGEYTWSDFNDSRGFTIFDTETNKIEFFQNPFTMHKMIVYDDKDSVINIEENMHSYANSFVKLVVKNKTNPHTYDMFFDKLYRACPLDISIVEDASFFENSDNIDNLIDQKEDTPTILDSYIDSLTLSVDSQHIKKYMRELYQEALTLENV